MRTSNLLLVLATTPLVYIWGGPVTAGDPQPGYTAGELAEAKELVAKLPQALREALEQLARDTNSSVEAVYLDMLPLPGQGSLGRPSATPNIPDANGGARDRN